MTLSPRCGKRWEADISSPASFCPFVGLQPYTEDDRDYFFGRQREQRVTSSNLYAARLTILYGASGVGKSSILRAGVVPFLQSASRTAVVYFNQWQDPSFLARLKLECLKAVEEKHGKPLQVDTAKPFHEFLLAIGRQFRGAVLILLDQFEEYFLYHPESQTEAAFDAEFASAVNSLDADVGFVIALRDDWLSRLDRFQARIPNLLGNTLRLEHLDAAAAEEAIRKPLEVYNRNFSNGAPALTIEDELVRAVLSQVRAGQLTLSESVGTGQAKAHEEGDRIETAFLQLVMTRLWDEEVKARSYVLRLSTFERLEGAKKIVQGYLDNVMSELSDAEREICARMFRYLVTPKGAKIAHETPDLVAFGEQPAEKVTPLLDKLNVRRVLRRISPPERYEIFHDVLSPAILDWRARYVKDQEVAEAGKKAAIEAAEREREATRQRELDRAQSLAREQQRRAEQEARAARRFRLLALALGLVCFVAVAALVSASLERKMAQWQQAEAEKQRKRAEEKALALTAVKSGIARPGATIKYFVRDARDKRMADALEELGFRVEVQPQKGPGTVTNTIWFGKQVPTEEVKMVASASIGADLQITAILPFGNSSPRFNTNLIEVGSLPPLPAFPEIRRHTWTVEEVRAAERFTR